MTKRCEKCGNEYALGPLAFDAGLCSKCKPGFLGTPLWLDPSGAGTKDLWRTVLVVHLLMFFLFGMLLDCGVISEPGMLYCGTVMAHIGTRFVLAHFKGYPTLTKPQAIATMLLPGYGPFAFVALFHLAQQVRYGQ